MADGNEVASALCYTPGLTQEQGRKQVNRPPETLQNGMKADIGKIIDTSETGWLTKYQIIYILENWKALGLKLSTSTPQLPPSGTMFLYDRAANRYFRKDGHNWRKKGFGSTVRETHEKIKIAEKGVLNCYYAHSEEASGIMRRSYWMLDSYDNVVLVHYLEGTASRRMVTNADGSAIKPTCRRRKTMTSCKSPSFDKDCTQGAPGGPQTIGHGPSLDEAPMPQLPEFHDASMAQLMLSNGGYGNAEVMHVANAAQVAAAQAAAMQHQQHSQAMPGSGHPHQLLVDGSLFSSSPTQGQHYFSMPHDMQSANMLMQYGLHFNGSGLEMPSPSQQRDTDASGRANQSIPSSQHSAAQAHHQDKDSVVAGVPPALGGHALTSAGLAALHQQVAMIPFYGANVHLSQLQGFMMPPPPSVPVPAPEVPIPMTDQQQVVQGHDVGLKD